MGINQSSGEVSDVMLACFDGTHLVQQRAAASVCPRLRIAHLMAAEPKKPDSFLYRRNWDILRDLPVYAK